MKYLISTAMAALLCGSSPAMSQTTATSQSAPTMLKSVELAPAATTAFYTARAQKPVWNDAAQFDALVQAIEGLSAHGLNPADYHLAALLSPMTPDDQRDRLATDAWFSAAANMLYGKLNPVSVEPDWTASGRQADLQVALSAALDGNAIAASLESFAPKQPGYAALKAEYKALIAASALPQTVIPAGETMKAGQTSPRIKTLKIRLAELGYMPEPEAGTEFSAVMDADTVAAVKAFQLASDLDDDGAVGAGTLNTLNRGLAQKIDQVRVNMERWRWLPDDLGRRHLRANIAGFNVTAWKDGVQERSHLTIVGKPYRKTPVFSDEIEYLVLNPWWETPYSLATKDKLPAFRKDAGLAKKLGFQVLDKSGGVVDSASIDWNSVSASNFPYRLRQAPGDTNALGQVKIIFPNKHNVYLHDTPTRGLFAQRQRAFSSGCLRTENPLDLSAWLLEDTPDWTRERITTTVASKKETRVSLSKTVPVHVLYFTVVSEGELGVRYLDDIYARDAAVLAGLNAKPKPR